MEENGFHCQIRHRELFGSIALESETWPQLLLTDPENEAEARARLQEILSADPGKDSGKEWTCFNCRERIEGQFTECWNCGYSRR